MANNIVFREDGCILVKNVRLSYPHLFRAWGLNEGDTKKFSGKFLLDKKTHAEEIKAMGKHLVKMQTEAFKGRIPNDKLCLRDGAESGKEEMANVFAIAASESTRPNVINRDRSPINEEDDIVYAGCFCNVLIRFWVQNNKFGKRINANLLAVQFVKDGERFSGIDRPDMADVFDDVEEDFDGAGDADGDENPFG